LTWSTWTSMYSPTRQQQRVCWSPPHKTIDNASTRHPADSLDSLACRYVLESKVVPLKTDERQVAEILAGVRTSPTSWWRTSNSLTSTTHDFGDDVPERELQRGGVLRA
jgi:hypothetical protein